MTDTDQPEIDKYTETDDEGRQVFGEEFRKKYPVLGKFGSAMMAPNRNIIGREYEKSQLLAAMNRPEICNALLLAPPGSGKLLPLDTPIPTPEGWTTMGALEQGSGVLGRDGKPAKVSYVSAVEESPELMEMRLSLSVPGWGTRIKGEISCVDHQWLVAPASDPSSERIMTTAEIAQSTERWVIASAAPLQLPDVDVDFDLSCLGRDVVEGVREDHDVVIEDLKKVLRGSETQRREVFEAMIRYSPHRALKNGESGSFEVWLKDSTSDQRIEASFVVFELMQTLGIEVKMETVDSSDEDAAFGISFLDSDSPLYFEVVGTREVESVPGKCIQVDNVESMYLCGYDFVPTHNTALVQATMLDDTDRIYLELDLATMISEVSTADKLAGMIKNMFNEAAEYARDEAGKELVLFIDEFHQIIQLSEAAVEALKPGLAASGVLGIRVIAATTFEEFHKHIADNQPLVERLQRTNVAPPDSATTVRILREMAVRYDVIDHFYDDQVFEMIHELTERYQPASVQPRKSILLLDSMVGWHRLTDRPMDRHLLADVLKETTGINVAFRVDASKIKKTLDSKVYGQDLATRTLANRLQLAVADLQDKGKPISSFLFAGSTGVGKTELTKQLAKLLFGDDRGHLIRFDMSEYSLEDSVHAFRSELTKRVWDMGHAVLLFDEIEKASRNVTRMLLQVLDDGRLTNDVGRQVSFLNTYIVLTTNAGSEIFDNIARYNVDDDGSGEEMASQLKKIKRSIVETQDEGKFPPELIGRIDQVVPFQPLSENTFERVVVNKLSSFVRDVMAKHGVEVGMTDRVITYLIGDKLNAEASEGGGARGAIQQMNEEVFTAVAEFINHHPDKKSIMVDIKGEMRTGNKYRLKSFAKPVVYEKR